jgi:hypothetical protein
MLIPRSGALKKYILHNTASAANVAIPVVRRNPDSKTTRG